MYAIDMGSGAMIYIPSLIKNGSGIRQLTGGYTHGQHGDRISLLLFFQNKEIRLTYSPLLSDFITYD
jgi:hypothetical protein